MLRVAVCGAAGRMGKEVVKAVASAGDMTLVAAIDLTATGQDAGEVAGIDRLGVSIDKDLSPALGSSAPDVMVDFTIPSAIIANAHAAIEAGVSPVIGTTGLSREDIDRIDAECRSRGIGAIIAPNFAIGAVLMMKFAGIAAKYASSAEIVELHHDRKLDSPSGTAIKTAQLMSGGSTENQGQERSPVSGEVLRGARGAELGGVRIHSVRLEGLVAHQEVIFGLPGQVLTIRHDSLSRDSFMPGVLLAIRRVRGLTGAAYGLEGLID